MIEDLDKLTTEGLGKLFPIKISEYNPEWKKQFILEKQSIQKAIGINRIRRIEHIGSTAVPGLCAKPTIDILVEIQEDANTDLIIKNLKQIKYHFILRQDNPPPHMMFAKGYSLKGYLGQTFHIHIRYGGDWDELIFRDYLIHNTEIAGEYANLKKRLSTDYVNDREKYTINKTEFITRIIKSARKELKNKNLH